MFPGVGIFIGFVLGAFIGNLFGRKKPRVPTANAEVALQIPNAVYALGAVTGNTGGNLDLVRSMGLAARDTLNGLIETITRGDPNAKVSNTLSPSQWYGHTGGQLWVRLGAQNAANQNVQSADEAVDKGVLYALPATQIIGGDLFLKRALYNMVRNPGQVKSVAQLAGDLQIAEDYAFYLQNREIIDAMIAEPWTSMSQAQKDFYNANKAFMTRALAKESVALNATDTAFYNANKPMVDSIIADLNLTQFAAAWIITLQRAAELELNRTAVSDFYGGAKGFVDSLGLTMTGGPVDYELVRFRMDGDALVTRYAPEGTKPSGNLVLGGELQAGPAPLVSAWDGGTGAPFEIRQESVDGQPTLVVRKSAGSHRAWGWIYSGSLHWKGGDRPDGYYSVSPGETIYYAYEAKDVSSPHMSLGSAVAFWDANGNWIGHQPGTHNWSDGWQRAGQSVVAPANAAYATVEFWIVYPESLGDNPAQAIAFKNFQFHRLPAGSAAPAFNGAPYEEFRSANFLADANYSSTNTAQERARSNYFDWSSATGAISYDDAWTVTETVTGGGEWVDYGWGYYYIEPYSYQTTNTYEGGDDIVRSGFGNDVLMGRSGHDWLDGGAGDDTLFGGDQDDVLIGGAGVDVLFGEAGDDVLIGGDGHDNPWWTVNPNHPFAGGLLGGDGNDRLRGGAGTDYVNGENGDDVIEVDQDAEWDFMDGGSGSDTLSYVRFESGGQSAGVSVALGVGPGWVGHVGSFSALGDDYANIENLTGSHFNDTLTGDAQANRLTGLSGDDVLSGADGDDTLEGGLGADVLIGGSGTDTASYNGSTSGVWADLTANEGFGGDAEGDTFNGIENLSGSDGADTFKGDAAANRLTGLNGDDWFIATAGADIHEGGEGFDTVDYGDFTTLSVIIDLQTGWHAGAAAGQSFASIEHIVGTQTHDAINGTAGDEVFTGGKGNDVFQGRSGSDTYVFERGDGIDSITETWDGSNTIAFSGDLTWNDVWFSTPPGNLEWGIIGTADKLISINNWDSNQNNKIKRIDMGGAGAIDINHINFAPSGASDWHDTIWGMNWGRDLIFAYNGDDVIYGANGGGWEQNGNVIAGGRGNDTIITSNGDDQFVFERGSGVDTITDSGGEDMIVFGPTVAAEDVITEVVGRDLFIGIRDLSNPALTASQVSDRIRVVDGGTIFSDGWGSWEMHNTIEFVRAGGAEIDLRKLDIAWNHEYSWGGGGGGGDDGGGGNFYYPVVFDLGDDGLELIGVDQSTVAIDGGPDSPSMRIGWVGEQEGILALDRNGDGKITRLSEISFIADKAGAKTDMEGLQAYDSNADGVLDAKDARWGEFRIWRDANGNGRGAGKELMTLAEAGITSLSLSLSPTGFTRAGMTDNLSLNTAVFTRADGTQGIAHDVALAARIAHLKGLATGEKRPEWKARLTDGEFGVLKGQNGKALNLAKATKGALAPEQKVKIDTSDAKDGKVAPKKITRKKGTFADVAAALAAGSPAPPSAGPGAPIVIDLAGDGVDLIAPTASAVWYDLNGDGWLDRVGWVGKGDAILALDRNGNGRIEVLDEISFLSDKPGAISDLDGLSAFDSNGDGALTAADGQFADFVLWQDINQDGVSQGEELRSLAEAGLVSLNLDLSAGADLPEAPLDNVVLRATTAIFDNGAVRVGYDVALGSHSGLALALAGGAVDPATLSASPFGDADPLDGRGLSPWSLGRDLRRILTAGPDGGDIATQPERLHPFASVEEDAAEVRFAPRTPNLTEPGERGLPRDMASPQRIALADDGFEAGRVLREADSHAPVASVDAGEARSSPRGRNRWWTKILSVSADPQESLSEVMRRLESRSIDATAPIFPEAKGALQDLTQSIDALRQNIASLGPRAGGEAQMGQRREAQDRMDGVTGSGSWRLRRRDLV